MRIILHIDKVLEKIVVVLYVGLVLTMGLATLLEYGLGSSFVYQHIYYSSAFCLAWAVLAILTVALCVRLKMWKRIFLFLMHISFGVLTQELCKNAQKVVSIEIDESLFDVLDWQERFYTFTYGHVFFSVY